MNIGNYIFAFTVGYLKYASVLEQFTVPQTWGPCTQDGGSKLPAKVYDSNFLFFVCRLGRAPRETRMASGWRGYVWALKKSGVFRDSAQYGLQIPAQEYIWRNTKVHMNYEKCNIYLPAKTNGWKPWWNKV
jgi:hypothetical protein